MVSIDACVASVFMENVQEDEDRKTELTNMASLPQPQEKLCRPTIRCDELQGLTLKEIITEMTTCVHCTEHSQHLFLLPCGHSMCSSCIQDFKTVDQAPDAEIWVPCPGMCDYTIVFKGGQLDDSIQELNGVGLLTLLNQNDRSCEEHSRADDISPTSPRLSVSPPNARFICADCDISLCRSCAQQHCIPHPWEHRIQNLEDYHAQLLREAFKCLKHGERLSIYCLNCDQPVCHVCCAVAHTGHKLKELSSGDDIQKAVENTQAQLKRVLVTTKKRRAELGDIKVGCEEQQVTAVNSVRAEEQKVIETVEKTADALVHEITNLHTGVIERIHRTDNAISGKQKMASLMDNLLASAMVSEPDNIMSIFRFYMENDKVFQRDLPELEGCVAKIHFVPANIDSHDVLGKIENKNCRSHTATEGVLNTYTARRLSIVSGSEAPELPEFETVESEPINQGKMFTLRETLKVPLLIDYVNVSDRLVSPCPSRVLATDNGRFIIRERCSNAIIELSPNKHEPSSYCVTKVFRGCDKYFLQDPIDIALHEGHILVLDRAINRQCLVVFDRTGRGKQVLNFDRKPNTICCQGGNLYIGFYSKICCYAMKLKQDCAGRFDFRLVRTIRLDGKWPWHIAANKDGLVVANLQGKELMCLHNVNKKDRVQTVTDTNMEMRGLSFLGNTLLITDRTGSRILSLEITQDVPNLREADVVLDSGDGVKNPVGLATGLNGEVMVGQENGELRMYVSE